MSGPETSISPEEEEDQTTRNGNRVTVLPGGIYVEGNNNTVLTNSHDITLEVQQRHNGQRKKKHAIGSEHAEEDKDIRMMFLRCSQHYEENCKDFTDEERALIREKASDLEAIIRKFGPHLQSITCGSLRFCLSVHDSYALENLMESHKSGRFLRELAKVFVTENEVEDFCQSWSTHIDEQAYATVLCKLKTIENASKNILSEWNRSQVREWLSSEVNLKDDIVDKFYEEEIIGKNLLVYEDKEIEQDFQLLKKTDFRMIQYSLEEKRSDALKDPQVALKSVTKDCSAEMVYHLLLKVGLTPIHAEKFKNLDMTGFKFMRYRKEHFKDDFFLMTGPLRLVLHLQKLSQNSQISSTDVETTGIGVYSTQTEDTHTGMKAVEKLDNLCKVDSMLFKSTNTSEEKGEDTKERKSSIPLSTALLKVKMGGDEESVESNINEATKKKEELFQVVLADKPCTSKTKKKKKHAKAGRSTFSEAEERVRELLLGSLQLNVTFDVIYNVILVVNDPDEEIKMNLKDSFGFISKVKWKAVFDFDANSNERGICKLMRSTREVKLYDIKDLSNVKVPSEISYAEVPAWIFSNGRIDIDMEGMDRMTWIKKRSHDMDKAVEFFSNTSVIRRDTGLVIFILLSTNIEVMGEAFRKFYTDFGIHRIVLISENEQVFGEWCKIVSRYCKQEELLDRAIVGVPWSSLNEIIMRMQGVNVKSDYILPTCNGKGCYLWEKDRSKWLDLSVVTYNECDNTDMNEKHPDFERFCKERELEFYRGEKLSFWNFKLTDMNYDHVCQRDIKQQMIKFAETKIKEPSQQSKTLQAVFQWIHLYHQPGAGGSTVIKHVLWEFRKKYRCIILKKITDQTESQILEMWSYGEEDDKRHCLPIVIVSDNLCYDDLTDMIISLEYKTKNIPDRTCIILNCRRYLSVIEGKKEQTESHHYNFFLEHSLTDIERAWFHTKHNQLETKMKKDKDFMPDRLLAFMVMKEEFQSEYVEKTVSRILSNLQEQHPQELELIKFCALFSKFERDSAIPIPCCDEFMGFAFSVKKKRDCAWEYDISEGSSLLMVTVDIYEVGSVQGFKIVHPTVADFILKDTISEPLNSIVENYLNSKLLIAKSHSREYLAARTHDLLIRRNPTGFDPSNRPTFSALILAITEDDKEAACRVLILGFDILQDPMIAQQIARYYSLEIEDYTKALKFIEKAIDMKKDNSFLWDTKGQIYRNELIRSFYNKYVVRHEVLSIDGSVGVLQLALKGIGSFRTSQSLVDRRDNTSCFSGEVDTTFKLLDVLTSLDVLLKSVNGRQMLQRYLVDKSYKPNELSKWAEHHEAMKGLMKNVQVAIDNLTNYFTVQKEWSNFTQIDRSMIEGLKSKVNNYYSQWKTHFGSISILDIDLNTVPAETINEVRRIKARKLGAHNIGKIFDLVKEDNVEILLEIRKLLLQNNPYNAFDLKTLLLANLALSATVNMNRLQYDLPSMKEIIDLAKEFDQRDQNEGDYSLYAPFFLLMLLWPRYQPAQEYDNSLMKKSLKVIRHRWSKSQSQNHEDDGRSSLHPLYGRHLKSQRTRKKPLVHFFLGSGKGLKSLVHYSKITSNASRLERERDREHIWETPVVRDNLLRVEGVSSDNNEITFKHAYTDESINIPLASSRDRAVNSREEVVFYIGFSWGGPVAYYVKPKSMSHLTEPVAKSPDDWRPSPPPMRSASTRKYVQIMSAAEYHKRYRSLNKKLSEINELKEKTQKGKTLEKNQQMKVNREGDYKQQLKELEDEFRKQLDLETTLGE